jgi:hypothetical protein
MLNGSAAAPLVDIDTDSDNNGTIDYALTFYGTWTGDP